MPGSSDEALDAERAARLAKALASYQATAPAAEVAELMRSIDEADAQADAASRSGVEGDVDQPELAWANSLRGKGKLQKPARPSFVNKAGGIVGFDKYEKIDPNLIETLIQYLEHPKKFKTSFAGAREIALPEKTSLAIAGDWATGYWQGDATAAKRVADRMAAAEYTIHLGDTYYAGRPQEIEEHLGKWPKAGTDFAFAIRGNHEMYCNGGRPFMKRMPTLFPAQNGVSCFSMTNQNWLVLALDTAYFAKPMFLDGTIGPKKKAQWTFAASQLERARAAKRKVILFTHHAPFDLTRDKRSDLHKEVRTLFAAHLDTEGPELWAWGHLHNAAAYTNKPGKFRGRLIGHGAVPFGRSRDLKGCLENGVIHWRETVKAGDARYPERVTNGFLRIDLDGPDAVDTLWAESGETPRWTGTKF